MSKKKKAPPQLVGDEIITRQTLGWNALGNLPNPSPILRQMGRIPEIHRQLRTDAHLRGEERKRLGAVRNKPWVLQEGADAPRKEIEEILWRLNMRDIITQIMQAAARGFSVMEVVWENNGERIWPVKVVGKPQDAFAFDSQNRLLMKTVAQPMGVLVPDYRFLLAQNEPEFDNPYGDGYINQCFWPVAFKRGGVKFWVKFVEKYAGVFAIGKYPRNSPQGDRDAFLESLHGLVQDACGVIPNDGSVELKEAAGKGTSADIYEKLCAWADRQISIVIVGQTLTANIGSSGSFAAANTHYQVSQDVAKDDATLVQTVMNQLVGWIWDLNFGTEGRPWWSLVAPQDLKLELVERDLKLTQCGARFTPRYYIDTFGFSEEHIAADTPPDGAKPISFAAGEPSGQYADVAAAMTAPLAEIAKRCGSYEEFMEAVTDHLAMIADGDLENELARLGVAAARKGYDAGS